MPGEMLLRVFGVALLQDELRRRALALIGGMLAWVIQVDPCRLFTAESAAGITQGRQEGKLN